ncbi:MAG: nucleotidyltransferase domain-containing protein [Mariprofundaceae bacterium]|nr:nucleotidyltransferase domain-containing protein [Mariprofundaceae bacterium]
MLVDKVLLQEMVKRMCQAGRPEKIVLFGSMARGEEHANSDVDLLVIEHTDLPRYKRSSLYRRAVRGMCIAKDIVVFPQKEVAEWETVPNAFITTILREGKVLYEA